MTKIKLILASKSPRRKELLNQINADFDIYPSTFDEKLISINEPIELAMELSFQKALVVSRVFERSYILGADTIVNLENEIMHQPLDENDAIKMLKKLSNKRHTVITGYSIINISEDLYIKKFVSTEVEFRKLSLNEIDRYIKTKEPFDKAGAYGIQGFAGQFIRRIKGCYFNVVGLPLEAITNELNKLNLDYYK
jgi:septum formation protein